ncbi:MAG: energy-coupling factor transporter ATPase [Coriobacteriales bacterium]|nr:energy-coupling factor transporter ATPase [Coriobacteriales bacterium]
MTAIDFEGVRFSYDDSKNALDGVTLHIAAGEFVAVLGGNGSGKSTLAKHVNALLVPRTGTVLTLGMDTQDPDSLYLIRQNAGMVFQNPDDQLVATLVENEVAFGPENLGVSSSELELRVRDALHEVGFRDASFATHETNALSGGQKQRLAIAGVLAMEPRILILDEATAMLDPRGRRGLLRIARELNANGMTVIMITHSMEEAAQASRVIVLREGRIVADGSPAQVLCDKETLSSLHLRLPFAVRLSLALQQRGIPVSIHLDESSLEEELCSLNSAM